MRTMGKTARFTLLMLCLAVFCLANPAEERAQDSPPPPDTSTPLGIHEDSDIIEAMLASAHLTRETARLDPETLESLATSAMPQRHFMRYWKNPYLFPEFVSSLVSSHATAWEKEDGIFQEFLLSQIRTGHVVCFMPSRVAAFAPNTQTPIEEALAEVCRRSNVTLTDDARAKVKAATEGAPRDIQLSVAKFLFAAAEAKYYRDRALRNYPSERLPRAFDFALHAFSPDGEKAYEDGSIINWDLGQALDYDDLFFGALPNIRAIMEFVQFARKLDSNVAFEFDTPLGKVAFNGRHEDNDYHACPYLLIADLAGNDTYNGSAAASWCLEHPISTIIDMEGDDHYVSGKETPCSQGAGILGYGFLIDEGGNDTFEACDNAQGMCYFGVGILWARGGDDVFKANTSAQGSAAFGIANFIKVGGNDSYHCYFTGQGFGFVGGYGYLLDTSGDDRFVAEPYDLVRPATGGHDNLRNYNFCQGAGWGQRGDLSDGHSMAGGTGVLQDLDGNDFYECGVFGQATGYWYGTGILHDKAGNDHYEGSFFVQSGTAHMGLTELLDESGNDTYHVWHAISLGGAHDVSVSIFIDRSGDDTFSCWEWKDEEEKQSIRETGKKGAGGGVLLGSAITNSVGIFINLGGNDTYELYTKDSLGYCLSRSDPGSWRYDNLTIGMFIDVGGKDIYDRSVELDFVGKWPEAANNHSWTQVSQPGNPDKSFGMGIDVELGKVPEGSY